MAASSTTRRGNGAGKGEGWGGPAKGSPERKPMAAEFQTGNRIALLPKNERRAARLEQLEEVLDHVAHLAKHAESESAQVTAGLGFAKLYMKPEAQAIELTGPDGAPIKQDLSITVAFRKPSVSE